MKVRDSGMPERDYWETLLDVPRILDDLHIDAAIADAVELGCGYGTFTVPIAQRIAGMLHAFDIDPEMFERTRKRTATAALTNIRINHRDVLAHGYGLPPGSVDAVFLFNILHADQPVAMLATAADLLRPGGRLLAIHWRSDVTTPRGPALSVRPRPEDIVAWAEATGKLVAKGSPLLLPPWHFGVALTAFAKCRAAAPPTAP